MSASEQIIAAELFDFVTDYAKALSAKEAAVTDPIDGLHDLIQFTGNFLAQFSTGYLNKPIEGFNARSLAQLKEARHDIENAEGTVEAQRLIFHLEPLCTRMPEISYSHSSQDAADFHRVYFPQFLDRIGAWLVEAGAATAVRDAAAAASSAFKNAIEAQPS